MEYDSDSDTDVYDCEEGLKHSFRIERRANARMEFFSLAVFAFLAVMGIRIFGVPSAEWPVAVLSTAAKSTRVVFRVAFSRHMLGEEWQGSLAQHGWREKRRLADDGIDTASCTRDTGSRCFAEGSTLVSSCDQDEFGAQVQCDIWIHGGLYKGVEGGGGQCICPPGYCRDDAHGDKCIAQAGHVPWTSSYVTTSRSVRLTHVLTNTSDDARRKELTLQAIEECEGVRYDSTIITMGNPQHARCVFAREVIETCGYVVAAFWLNELEDKGGKGRFLEVCIVGLVLTSIAKIACSIVIIYFATVFFQDEITDLLIQAEARDQVAATEKPSFSQMTCKQRAGLIFSFVLKIILAVGGIYVVAQLLYLAIFNTVVFLNGHREFMDTIRDLDVSTGRYQDPCRFWMATRYIQYGQLAELFGLCFISWFDVIAWVIVVVWTCLLCLSSCCWWICCWCSYIWCCVCCKNCTFMSWLCTVVFGLCSTCMLMIILIPLIVCVLGFLICVVVWIILALICILIFGLLWALCLTLVLAIAYGFARVLAVVFGLEWKYDGATLTFFTFLTLWSRNQQLTMAVLMAGDFGLKYLGVDPDQKTSLAIVRPDQPYEYQKKETRYFSTGFLMYIVKRSRLILVFALLVPVLVTVLIFITELCGKFSFSNFVAAQITELRSPPYSPEPDENYDVGEHWKSFFEDYFPDLVKTLFHKYLPALYVGVPSAIVEAIGNLFDDTSIRIPSIVQMWNGFADYMANVKVEMDIDKLIDLNYYARIIVAGIEALLLLAAMVASSLQSYLSQAVEQAQKVVEEAAPAVLEKADGVADKVETAVAATLGTLDQLMSGEEVNIDLEVLQQCAEAVTNDQLTLLLQTNNIPELAALLGTASIEDMKRYKKLTTGVKEDDSSKLPPIITEDDLLRQDKDGNVAMHHVRSTDMFKFMYSINPESVHARNNAGESALGTLMRRGLDINELMAHMTPYSSARKYLKDLLALNTEGICPAMEMAKDSPTFRALEDLLPKWEQVRQVLTSKSVPELLSGSHALEIAPEGEDSTEELDIWHISLVLNLFGESDVWKLGQHTQRTKERLPFVGTCLVMLLTEYENLGRAGGDNHKIADLLRAIFKATKGPNRPNFDARESYWEEVNRLLEEMSARTKTDLDSAYAKLTPAITSDIPMFQLMTEATATSKAISNKKAQKSAELRQDFKSLWRHQDWAQASSEGHSSVRALKHMPIMASAAKDFAEAGIIKGINATKDFQSICEGFYNKSYSFLDKHNLQVMRCDARYRRDMCDKYQKEVQACFQNILTDCHIDPNEENLTARSQAKGMERLMQKVHELLGAVEDDPEIFQRAIEFGCEQDVRNQLRTAGDFITDVNGVTLIVDTEEQFTRLYQYIQARNYEEHGCELLRVKSSYNKDKDCPDGYRDLKLWVAVNPFLNNASGRKDTFPLVVETQLHLRQFFKFKETLMHLPYEVTRGSFDHAHVAELRNARRMSTQ